MASSFDPSREYDVLSVGEWVLTMFILAIPLVNIVMLFVWGFGESAHPTKRNYSRAALLIYAILFGIGLLFVVFGLVVGGMGVFGDLAMLS